MANEEFNTELNKLISETLEKLAMMHYRNEIKGCLILVIDKDNVFRLMEAYGSNTILSMNTALDIAKSNAINMIKRSMTTPTEKE